MMFKYINEALPYNKELASEIGVDYANDGKSIRYDPIRVEIDSWIEDHQMVCDSKANWGECICSGLAYEDCSRCTECNDYESETIEIRTPKHTYTFSRYLHRKIGSVWTNWLDESYAITPAK